MEGAYTDTDSEIPNSHTKTKGKRTPLCTHMYVICTYFLCQYLLAAAVQNDTDLELKSLTPYQKKKKKREREKHLFTYMYVFSIYTCARQKPVFFYIFALYLLLCKVTRHCNSSLQFFFCLAMKSSNLFKSSSPSPSSSLSTSSLSPPLSSQSSS